MLRRKNRFPELFELSTSMYPRDSHTTRSFRMLPLFSYITDFPNGFETQK